MLHAWPGAGPLQNGGAVSGKRGFTRVEPCRGARGPGQTQQRVGQSPRKTKEAEETPMGSLFLEVSLGAQM